MDIIIRKAEEQDLQAILDIYNDAILNTTAVYVYKPHTLEKQREWFKQNEKDNFPIFVAVQNEEVIGFSYYGHFRTRPAYKYTAEISVYIHPQHRGKGVAKFLYPPLFKTAREQQLRTLVAVIDSENDMSIKLHEHFGFTITGHFKQVGYKFGRWLDLVFMQLMLDTPEHPVED